VIAGVDLDLVLLAMAIGVAIEAPLGAVNLIVIRASLRSGLAGGLAAASGSIIGEAAFAGAVAFSIQEIGDLLLRYGLLLQIVGGIFLLAMGIGTFRTHIADRALRVESQARNPLWRKAISTFVLTITNPATFMGMVAIFGGMASMIHLASSPERPWLAVVGVTAGAFLWWLFIATLVTRLSKRLTGTTIDNLNHWTGLGIIGLGLAVLANVALRFA
jgi:threonine/homoserine/homoserine lactone efflux protein